MQSKAIWLCCLMVAAALTALAQVTPTEPAALNLTLGEQRVRFAPTRSFQEMQLEVRNYVGEIVFTHTTTEAEFDWNLRASNNEALTPGLYRYALTLKFSEDQSRQHTGHFIVEKGQDQIWLTANEGAEISGTVLNAVRSGGRSIAVLTAAEDKSVKRDVSGRELVNEKGSKLTDDKKAKQEKASLLGATNRVAKFGAGGLADTDSNLFDVGLNVGIGTTAPASPLTVSSNPATLQAPPPNTLLHIGAGNNITPRLLFDAYGAGIAPVMLFRRAQGTAAAPGALLTGDQILHLASIGYGGSGYSTTSRVSLIGFAAENWTNAAQGSHASISTTPIGTTTLTERMRITDAGNVGIGVTAPAHKLDVAGTINTTTQYNIGGDRIISGGGTNLIIGKDTNLFCQFGCPSFATAIGAGAVVAVSNSVVLGRSQDVVRVPGELSVSGNAEITGNLTVSGNTIITLGSPSDSQHICINGSNEIVDCSVSSARYKKNVTPLKAGLAEINRLRPVKFTWKTTDEKDVGLIAEEVAASVPMLALHEKDGATVKGVKYDQVNLLLINAVKEQQTQIRQLLKNNRRLSQRLARLERKGRKQ